MKTEPGLDELKSTLARMLERPRALRGQTMRHLEEHVEDIESGLVGFIARAPRELEEYKLETLFAPVFTPSFEEEEEVSDPLTRHRPSREEVASLITGLSGAVDSCPIVLPAGLLAPLPLHEVLIERYVSMLRLEWAPSSEVVEAIRDTLSGELATVALTVLRSRGMTPRHQAWYARFLHLAADRHPLDRETVVALAEFLRSRTSLGQADLIAGLDAHLRAAREAGAFAQKGRMYWSSDVAEHHQFRGQGAVDDRELGRRMREIQVIETLRADLEAFGDILGPLDLDRPETRDRR